MGTLQRLNNDLQQREHTESQHVGKIKCINEVYVKFIMHLWREEIGAALREYVLFSRTLCFSLVGLVQ